MEKHLAPYVSALFKSDEKDKIESGTSVLGNCIRNEESTPHYVQEEITPNLIGSVGVEAPLIQNFYASIGKYDPKHFRIQYSPLNKEASM